MFNRSQAASSVAAAIQSASSTAICGTPFDLDRDDRRAVAATRSIPLHSAGRRRAGRPGRARRRSPASPAASSPGCPGSDSPGRRVADAEPPPSRSASKARRATPVSTSRSSARRAGMPTALEAAVLEAFEGELLDRGAGAVGVEPDLAEEDPVGPGDRPLAQVDRVRAVEAVGEVAKAAADRLRAACPGRRRRSIQAIPRPGNSAAMWGATQPCSGHGLPVDPIACLLAPAISAAPRALGVARGGQQVVDPGRELGRRQVADAGAPAGCRRDRRRRRSGSRRPGRGRRRRRRGRSRPASSSRVRATSSRTVSAVVANVEREEVHPPTVALVDVADHVLLVDAAVAFA